MRTIVYLQYTNPAAYPPLENSATLLSKSRWRVWFCGTQGEGESSKLALSGDLAAHVNLWVQPPPGIRQKLQYAAFTLACLWRAFWERPAWVYCSDLMSCPAAWLIGLVTPCKVLYHEHDSPEDRRGRSEIGDRRSEAGKQKMEDRSGKIQEGRENRDHGLPTTDYGPVVSRPDAPPSARPRTSDLRPQTSAPVPISDLGPPTSGGSPPSAPVPISDLRSPISFFQRFLLWTRHRVGQQAELVVLPNHKRLELFVQATGRQKPSLCVFNCPRKEEVRPPKVEIRPQGKLRLAFHGSINRDRLPLALLEAMSRFPGQVELSIVGYETVGAKGYMAEFLNQAASLGWAKAIEFMGALPTRRALLQQASKCDVGLAFMPFQGGDINMVNMTGASNKPFDYLACGLALLVSDLADWNEMFVAPGYGLACQPDAAHSIAARINWFLEHPAETREMGERGRQRILTEWNYERQFAAVFSTLENTK